MNTKHLLLYISSSSYKELTFLNSLSGWSLLIFHELSDHKMLLNNKQESYITYCEDICFEKQMNQQNALQYCCLFPETK